MKDIIPENLKLWNKTTSATKGNTFWEHQGMIGQDSRKVYPKVRIRDEWRAVKLKIKLNIAFI